jgi:predicted transcriptional regulator
MKQEIDAEHLAHAINMSGWSIPDLATMIGHSKNEIQSWIDGKKNAPASALRLIWLLSHPSDIHVRTGLFLYRHMIEDYNKVEIP